MAELSRERGIETSEITIADDDDPNSPMNRIKRSNSFAEAVEMVILGSSLLCPCADRQSMRRQFRVLKIHWPRSGRL